MSRITLTRPAVAFCAALLALGSALPLPAQEGRQNGGSDAGAIVAGVGSALAVATILAHHSSPSLASRLEHSGPQFENAFGPDAFNVVGYVKGNWPLVLDFQIDQVGIIWIEITAKNVEPFLYRLDGTKVQRQYVRLTLPARFGDTPIPALISVRTLTDAAGEVQGLPLHINGIGAGPNAVGSVAIAEVHLQPPTIRVSKKERAAFDFTSEATFPNGAVEIFQADARSRGDDLLIPESFGKIPDGITPGKFVSGSQPKPWDGKVKRRPALGRHNLVVVGWTHAISDGSWVAATNQLTVEP